MVNWYSLITIIIILFNSFQCNAVVLINSFGTFGSGSAATSISDDFTGVDLSSWTEEVGGTWVLDTTSNNIDTPAATGFLSHNTELDGTNVYITIQVVSRGVGDEAGVGFRFDGNISNYMYAVTWKYADGDFHLYYCQGTTCTQINFWSNWINAGDYIGIEVEGTGTDTVFRVWEFPGLPPERGSWGSAGVTFTDNPAQEANTGVQVGLINLTSSSVTFDNFEAGTYTP